MKILYVIDTLSIGGAEQSLAAILPRYQDTEAIVCHLYLGDTIKPQLVDAGIEVYSLGLKGKYSLARAYTGLRRLVLDIQPDIVHSALFRSDFISRLVCRTVGVPHVTGLVSDSYSCIRYSQMQPDLRRKHHAIQILDRLSARFSAHFVANSETIKLSNSKALGIPLDAITVIYRGRDPDKFSRSGVDFAHLIEGLNLANRTPILLNVGRLVPQKNQISLVRSLTTILQKAPDCQLLIAGEGPERHSLETMIEQLNLRSSVQMLGFRSDIADLLQIADAYVFPSLSEGHPGSVVEAMLSNCPVIASDIPVHRETLFDGALGRLVPLRDPTDLANCVIKLIAEPDQTRNLAACARESAIQRFDVRVTAGQYERLYERIIGQKKARR